jgi:hypothetical protein
MAQAVSRRPHTVEAGSIHMGFVVDRVALGQICLRVLHLSLSVSFHRCSILINHVGVNNRPVGGRSSET